MAAAKSLICPDEAGFAIAHDAGRAAIRGDDGGNAGGQSLEHHVAEGVGVRGEDEGIHVGVGAGQIRAAQDAGELRAGRDARAARPLLRRGRR